jgi:hypothetical protein
MEVRNATGYLASRILFYLLNLHTQRRTMYFARAGDSKATTYKSDDDLNDQGKTYAKLLSNRFLSFRKEEAASELAQGDHLRPLIVYPHVSLISDLDIHSKFYETNGFSIPDRNS